MTERYYRFAGLEIAVQHPKDMPLLHENRLEPFRAEAVTTPHTFRFRKVDALTAPAGECVFRQPSFWVYEEPEAEVRYLGVMNNGWNNANLRAEHRGKDHLIELKASWCQNQLAGKILLEALAAEHLLAEAGGIVFHCSFIDHNGKAVLFTAPSETGKSTQADLWNRYRAAEIVNGDRAAIRITEEGRILAEGIPFSGSSTHCKNRSLPLEAIVYLGQAPRTTIRKMRGYEAFSKLWEGVTVNTWNRKDIERASDTVRQIAEKIPVFHMPCTPDESAVSVLEQELKKLVSL